MIHPSPTTEYLAAAALEAVKLTDEDGPQKMLIILDLNETLLFRPNRKPSRNKKFQRPFRDPNVHPALRPHLKGFMNYLFTHNDYYNVMVWSSAFKENVHKMADAAFSPSQREQLVTIWSREDLGLAAHQMRQKVVTYKDLNNVWKALERDGKGHFSQKNTILIDDSTIKASHQPHNHIEISTYAKRDETDTALLQVASYLEAFRLGMWNDVSAFMRANPFSQSETPIDDEVVERYFTPFKPIKGEKKERWRKRARGSDPSMMQGDETNPNQYGSDVEYDHSHLREEQFDDGEENDMHIDDVEEHDRDARDSSPYDSPSHKKFRRISMAYDDNKEKGTHEERQAGHWEHIRGQYSSENERSLLEDQHVDDSGYIAAPEEEMEHVKREMNNLARFYQNAQKNHKVPSDNAILDQKSRDADAKETPEDAALGQQKLGA